MRGLLRGLVLDLEVQDWTQLACDYTPTRSGQPVFSPVAPGVGAVVGGNGQAAKSGDELGRLAVASVMDGEGWDADYSATDFTGSTPDPSVIG